MAARWLFKTEPSDYSFADLVEDKKTEWEGVKNALALIHLRNVRKGDEILIYHTGKEKCIVGFARAAANAHDDLVSIVPGMSMANPVSLSAIKSDSSFKDFDLVRISRLAVMPVSDRHWKKILRMSEISA